MRSTLIAILLVVIGCVVASSGFAAQWHVSPTGTDAGPGTNLATALALTKALSASSPAAPGDTIWLHGGTYATNNSFGSELDGTANNPIIVRQAPGERAIIDCVNSGNELKSAIVVHGSYTWYWGFEVMNSHTDRTVARSAGFYIYGIENKFINLIVHDGGNGIGFWNHEQTATDEEVYGCLIYNGGWQGADPDRGHGHAIYAQNRLGTKLIRNNIMFSQFGWGLHVYTEGGYIQGFDIEGNVSFNHGIHQREGILNDNYLIGGYTSADRIVVRENASYSGGVRVGFTALNNVSIAFSNNYFARGILPGEFAFRYWTNLTIISNTFVPSSTIQMNRVVGPGTSTVLDYNTYHWSYTNNANVTAIWHFETDNYYTFTNPPGPAWQSKLQNSGWEINGTLITNSAAGYPTQNVVFVRTNLYEPGRANITVYNWELKDQVSVAAGNLSAGQRFEVRNAQDFFAPAVLSGTYTSGNLTLPMTNLTVATAVGLSATNAVTGPLFNMFVVLPVVRRTMNATRVTVGQ